MNEMRPWIVTALIPSYVRVYARTAEEAFAHVRSVHKDSRILQITAALDPDPPVAAQEAAAGGSAA